MMLCRPGHRAALFVTHLLLALLLGGLVAVAPRPLWAQGGWSTPLEITQGETGWFPSIAADYEGTLHVIWGSSGVDPNVPDPDAPAAGVDLLRYRALRNGIWTPVNDVVVTCRGPSRLTVRNSLVLNADGRLHVLVRMCLSVQSLSIPSDEAWSAQHWLTPTALGSSYYNALAADSQGRLHALYNEIVFGKPGETSLASEILYRRSEDGGQTWSLRKNLANLPGGDERMQLKVDPQGRLHAVWDHGSDAFIGLDEPEYGLYRRSDDGGETWQPPVVLGIAEEPTVQTSLGLTQEGNPLVVYRSATSEQIYFQHSRDGGQTWLGAEPIPGVKARNDVAGFRFDTSSMAVDSANRIHLLMTGFLERSNATVPSLLHLMWNGHSWSVPTIVAQGANYLTWPRTVITGGNQLHAVWFSHLTPDNWGELRVWYSSLQLDSPATPPPPKISLPENALVGSGPAPAESPADMPGSGSAAASAQPATFRELPPPDALSVHANALVITLALAAVTALLATVTLLTAWRRARR